MKRVEDLTNEQLDVLVTEKVMGWERETDAGATPWRPSTDIACAFRVDRPEWEWFFGEKGDDLHANVYVASEESGVYAVVVPLDPDNKTAAYCRGRCIAACYACGVTEV